MSAGSEDGRRLLLHVCCGPCSIMPTRRLQGEGFEVTAWYHNPNIQPLSEYLRRREAVLECAERAGIAVICDDAAWNLTAWLRAVQGRDTPPQRCDYCCRSRVAAAWEGHNAAPLRKSLEWKPRQNRRKIIRFVSALHYHRSSLHSSCYRFSQRTGKNEI